MMRFIVAFILSFLSFAASAQTTQILGAPNTRIATKGDMSVDSIFYLPRTLVTSRSPIQSGALRYQASDSALYQWTGTAWRKAGGGDVDTLLLSTRAWRQKGIDSLASVRIGGSGVTGYIPKFTAARTLDSSQIFQNDGRIGIGTATPTQRFHVGGSVAGTVGGMVRNTSNSSSAVSAMYVGNDTDIEGALLRMSSTSTGYAGASSLNVYTRWGHPIGFVTNNIERARISGSGRFIINDTSSSNIFYVKGNTSENGIALFKNNNQYLNFNLWNNQTPFSNATVSVNMGIGTTFAGASDRLYQFSNVARDATNADFNIAYWNGTTFNDRFRIFANGRIGVNTITDAGYQFDVAGSMRNTTDAAFATSSGNVGIGTTSPSYKLDVNGTARISGDGHILGNAAVGGVPSAFVKMYVLHADTNTTVFSNSFPTFGITNTTANGFSRFTFYNKDGQESAAMYMKNVNAGNTGNDLNFVTKGAASATWQNGMTLNTTSELLINYTSDQGAYNLQVNGNSLINGNIRTAAPAGGTANDWRLGTVATVTPTSPNRTIEVSIGGTIYYIHAKTTND